MQMLSAVEKTKSVEEEVIEEIKKIADIITGETKEETPSYIIKEIMGEKVGRFKKFDEDYLREKGISTEDVEYVLDIAFKLASLSVPPPKSEGKGEYHGPSKVSEYGGVFCRINDSLEFIESRYSGKMGIALDITDAYEKCKRMGGKPIVSLHTHPYGDLFPSNGDMETNLEFDIPMMCLAAKVRDEKKEEKIDSADVVFEREKLGVTCFEPTQPPPGKPQKDIANEKYRGKYIVNTILYYPEEYFLMSYAKRKGIDINNEEEYNKFVEEILKWWEPEPRDIVGRMIIEDDIEKYNEEAKKVFNAVIDSEKELVKAKIIIPKKHKNI